MIRNVMLNFWYHGFVCANTFEINFTVKCLWALCSAYTISLIYKKKPCEFGTLQFSAMRTVKIVKFSYQNHARTFAGECRGVWMIESLMCVVRPSILGSFFVYLIFTHGNCNCSSATYSRNSLLSAAVAMNNAFD